MEMIRVPTSSSAFNNARKAFALLAVVALGLLGLGTTSVQAQAYAACTDGATLAAPFFWIPSTGAGFQHSTGTSAATGAPTQNGCFYP